MFSQYDGSSDGPAGENAPSQKTAFQGPIAMHTAAPEARRFTGGIKTVYASSHGVQYLSLQVGFQAAERLAGKNMQLYRNEWPRTGVEQLVHRNRPYQFITNVFSGVPDRGYLCVFAKSAILLTVPRLYFPLYIINIQ